MENVSEMFAVSSWLMCLQMTFIILVFLTPKNAAQHNQKSNLRISQLMTEVVYRLIRIILLSII